MNEDYWDIDAILADQSRIPCSFRMDVPGYGFLEGNHDIDLAAGAKVELPYWLAEHLAIHDLVELELPVCFGHRVRNDLAASPMAVNLNRLCPYFYRFGVKIINLVVDAMLPTILSNALKARLPLIMDYTQTSKLRTDRSDFIMTLDETEKDIYKLGHESASQMTQWHQRKGTRIKTADVLMRKNQGTRY
ncbi:hypothetical protein BC832DRAFT_589730 [Gaertneriomyces semiglobifer]|nr:hypothetical protein BC832DRAFT_589730 [Gaertneriomyces semiglobifer]